MADKELKLNLIAKDGVSGPLKKISDAADDTTQALDKIGTEGNQSLDQVEKSAKSTEKAVDSVGNSADEAKSKFDGMGAAATAFGAALAYSGDAAMRQEQQVIGITRAYGDAADEMLRFAEELDSVTMFSDDDIRGGERYFASLRNNYDLSISQIKELMQVTADLASASGTSFEDASSRVTAAIRGEGEAAEYLGLTMNQASIDAQNLTLSMSNAEAAQFRYNALLEQSAAYQGTAGDMMQSNAGTIAEWRDRLDDTAASLGNLLGPAATFTAGLASMGFGITSIAGGLKTASSLGKGFQAALQGSSVAATALSFATGPVGIALGAIGVAGAIAAKVIGDNRKEAEEAEQAYQAFATSVEALDDAISSARLSGDFALARDLEAMNQTVETGLANMNGAFDKSIADLEAALDDPDNFQAALVTYMETGFARAAANWALDSGLIEQDVYDMITSGSEEAVGRAAPVITTIMSEYYEQFAPDDSAKARINAEVDEIFTLMGNELVDQERLIADFNQVWADFGVHGNVEQLISDLDALQTQTESTLEQLNSLVDLDYMRFRGEFDLADSIEQLGQLQGAVEQVNAFLTQGEQQAYADGWETISEAIRHGEVDADRVIGTLRNLEYQLASGQITEEEYARAVVALSMNLDDYAVATDDAAEATERLNQSAGRAVGQMTALALATKGARDETDALNRMLETERASWVEKGQAVDESRTKLAAYNDEMERLNQEFLQGFFALTGDEDFTSQLNLTQAATDASILAENLNDVGAALDNATRIAISNTDAIGSQMQGLKDWSDELIGDPGTWAEIDKLYNEGRISLKQYTEAQTAQVEITEANATVQRDLLAIQAMQAPILADSATAMADYVEQLRLMNDGTEEGARNQMAALALMDSGVQGQMQQLFDMYDLMATLGPEGREAFGQIIDGIVATDPYMTSVLENLGLIERQANGDYSINFEGFDQAASDIDNLNRTIADLIDLLDDGTLNKSYTANVDLEVEGQEDVESVKQDLNDLAALSAQERMIEISTKLMAPEPGSEDWEIWNTPIEPITIPSRLDVPTNVRDIGLEIPPVSVPVELDFGSVGSGASGLARNAAQEAMGQIQNTVEITVTANADTSAADAAISDLTAYDGTTIATPVVMIDGDASDATGTVTAMGGYDGMTLATAIVAVVGDSTNAAAVVNGIRMTDGSILATNYIDIVTRTRTEELALGGVVREYADGGVVIRAAERGPEIARFAGGGTAVLPHDGYYGVPVGTFISPNNAVGPALDAPQPIVIQNYGTIIGVDELTEIIGGAVIEAQAEEAARYNRAHGRVFG